MTSAFKLNYPQRNCLGLRGFEATDRHVKLITLVFRWELKLANAFRSNPQSPELRPRPLLLQAFPISPTGAGPHGTRGSVPQTAASGAFAQIRWNRQSAARLGNIEECWYGETNVSFDTPKLNSDAEINETLELEFGKPTHRCLD